MSNIFKVGDKVERINSNFSSMRIKDVGMVEGTLGDSLILQGKAGFFDAANFKLAEDTSKHHTHHDAIIAWAKGDEIQYRLEGDTRWYPTCSPSWNPSTKYRIKPTKTPQQVEFEALEQEMKSISERMTALKAEM